MPLWQWEEVQAMLRQRGRVRKASRQLQHAHVPRFLSATARTKVRYDEFRDRLQDALGRQGLSIHRVDRPKETIDLATTERRWRVFVFPLGSPRTEPLHVSARIGFRWSPFEAARSYTCEEDLLTELLGRKDRPTTTEPRFLRVDIILRATLPFGSNTAMPDPQIFGPWLTTVEEKIDELLSTEAKKRGGRTAVLGYRGEVEVEARHTSGGILSLQGLSLLAFRMVQVPRVWDDPEHREAEKGAGQQLDQLARQFKGALDEWTTKVVELATWIRYTPPPPVAGSDEGAPYDAEEEDDEPEITH